MSIQDRDSMKSPTPTATGLSASDAKVPAKPAHVDTARDHFESVLFALVLALLFRTFEAEAFVIPTGSMAPTLYGRHKESICTKCGHTITVGASDEMDAESGLLHEKTRIHYSLCPNCRYLNEITPALSFNGDRILVNKFPYELGNPSRWDVFVFKFPEEPNINYIKRLVGLPGETIRIRQGNLYQWDGKVEKILRKDDADKQNAIQIPVYDDRHVARELLQAGWPERWAAVAQTGGEDGVAGWNPIESAWKQDAQQRTFQCQGASTTDLNWIRYRHYIPSMAEWQLALDGGQQSPVPRLVTDFCGYNTYSGSEPHPAGGYPNIDAHAPDAIGAGEFWVGDLTLHCQLDLKSTGSQAELILELIEGGIRYQCRIDCNSATAVLFKQTADREIELASAPCGLSGPGTHHLRFANVDDRLVLWVDDQVIDFGKGAVLDQPNALIPNLPTDNDLTPVGIAASGLDATVSELLITRDIYYLANPSGKEFQEFQTALSKYLDHPEEWSRRYAEEAQHLDTEEIQITEDGYLALGDNSPRSRDSRMWNPSLQSVPRKFLVGKAFFIYWPHGVPFLNDGRGFSLRNYTDTQGQTVEDYPKYTFPFYPQVGRMKRIR
jgi:signal peptidase I